MTRIDTTLRLVRQQPVCQLYSRGTWVAFFKMQSSRIICFQSRYAQNVRYRGMIHFEEYDFSTLPRRCFNRRWILYAELFVRGTCCSQTENFPRDDYLLPRTPSMLNNDVCVTPEEKKHISRYENAHSRIYKTDSRLLRSSIANLHSAIFRCPSVITMRNVKAVRSSYKKLGRWKKVPEKPRNELYTLSWRACEIFKMVPVEAA